MRRDQLKFALGLDVDGTSFNTRGDWKVYPDTPLILRYCHDKGYPVTMHTVGAARLQRSKLRTYPYFERLEADGIYIVPELAGKRASLQSMRNDPLKCPENPRHMVYVDNLYAPMEWAREAGLTCVLITRADRNHRIDEMTKESQRPHHRIESLDTLIGIFEEMRNGHYAP